MNPTLAELRAHAERTAAAVWREVLDGVEIGLDDNIFDLGGSSLHVVQALSSLREKLDVPIAVLDMFKYPTIRSLVRFLYPDQQPELKRNVATERASRQRRALEGMRISMSNRSEN